MKCQLLTYTSSIRRDALPPTSLQTYMASDFTKFSGRTEYDFVAKPRGSKLLQLDKNDLADRFTEGKLEWHFSRDRELGGSTMPIPQVPDDL